MVVVGVGRVLVVSTALRSATAAARAAAAAVSTSTRRRVPTNEGWHRQALTRRGGGEINTNETAENSQGWTIRLLPITLGCNMNTGVDDKTVCTTAYCSLTRLDA